MTMPNQDPGNSLEPTFDSLRAGVFVNANQARILFGGVQARIGDISRIPSAEISEGQAHLSRRVSRSGSRVAIELLMQEPNLPFPAEEDRVTLDYEQAVEASLKTAENVFEVFKHSSVEALRPLADRALGLKAGQHAEHYTGSDQGLAAYLEQVATLVNIVGIAKLEAPELRAPLEDYAQAVMGLITAISDRRHGISVDEKLERYFAELERSMVLAGN